MGGIKANFFKNSVIIPLGNIIAAYQFENNADDSIGTYNATATSVSYVTGKVNKCADFTASTASQVQYNSTSAFSFSNGINDLPFSVSFYMKVSVSGNIQFISKYTNADREWDFLRTTSGNLFYFRVWDKDNSNSNAYVSLSWSIPVDTWFHIIGTYNGNSVSPVLNIYRDGILVTGPTLISGTYVRMRTGNGKLTIGRLADATTFSLNGYMDEVFIWDKELSASEISLLYEKQSSGVNILS